VSSKPPARDALPAPAERREGSRDQQVATAVASLLRGFSSLRPDDGLFQKQTRLYPVVVRGYRLIEDPVGNFVEVRFWLDASPPGDPGGYYVYGQQEEGQTLVTKLQEHLGDNVYIDDVDLVFRVGLSYFDPPLRPEDEVEGHQLPAIVSTFGQVVAETEIDEHLDIGALQRVRRAFEQMAPTVAQASLEVLEERVPDFEGEDGDDEARAHYFTVRNRLAQLLLPPEEREAFLHAATKAYAEIATVTSEASMVVGSVDTGLFNPERFKPRLGDETEALMLLMRTYMRNLIAAKDETVIDAEAEAAQ